MSLRLAFMGTPDFSVPCLAEILAAGHDVVAVYSQPPRPAGRGKKERKSPVQIFAEEAGIEVRHPKSLRGKEEQAAFAALNLDAAVVVAYGLILPKAILDAPKHGCFNVHASLLPRWRGAAPIQRAIMAGDKETGVNIMQMDEGLDTGPVLLSERKSIGDHDTADALHDRLSQIGASAMVRALSALERDALTATVQPEEGVTYAEKISKDEARIDWSKPASELDCHIRGLTSFPGAWFEAEGDKGPVRIKALKVKPVSGSGAPGELIDLPLTIACGDGALQIDEVQRAGKARCSAEEFLRGFKLSKGDRVS